MQWIALQWPPEAWHDALAGKAQPAGWSGGSDDCAAGEAARQGSGFDPNLCAYWALQFTPRVVWMGEALLLEVSSSLRLWGGLRALLRRLDEQNPALAGMHKAQAAIGLIAVAQLRLRAAGLAAPPPGQCPVALPLHTLDAAQAHLPVLERLGCRTWGQAHALPRGGLVRRFGPALRAALDVAFGLAPESYRWLTLPEQFDQALELHARVDNAPALLWAATRLLGSLQHWLRARQLGVLAFELSWTLDLRRLDGQTLPPEQALPIRTAQPTQAMDHLRRLLAERLAQVRLAAPAVHLRLRATDTAPWQADSRSLLPEDRRRGDPLHVFIERVSARLGADRVLAAEPVADHRPERQQRWQPAVQALAGTPAKPPSPAGAGAAQAARKTNRAAASASPAHPAPPAGWPDALAPTSLLAVPLALATHQGQPCHHGPLRLLTAARRVEAGWWPEAPLGDAATPAPPGQHTDPSPASRVALAGRAADGASGRRPRTANTDPLTNSSHQPPAVGHAARATGERRHPEPSPGRPKAASAPLRGSGPCEAGERGGPEPSPGRPKAASAPLGGSGPCEAGERGGLEPSPGRPKAASAPLGGSGPCEAGERGGQFPCRRDYFIAQNPRGELLWVFCERPTAARPGGPAQAPRWFLHGLYA